MLRCAARKMPEPKGENNQAPINHFRGDNKHAFRQHSVVLEKGDLQTIPSPQWRHDRKLARRTSKDHAPFKGKDDTTFIAHRTKGYEDELNRKYTLIGNYVECFDAGEEGRTQRSESSMKTPACSQYL